MSEPVESLKQANAVAIDNISDQRALAISSNGTGDVFPALSSIEIAWLLWRNRNFFFRATVGGLLLFTLIAFLLPKYYTATTTLMPPDSDSMSALEMALPALSSGNDSTSGTSGGSIMGMASRLLGLNTSGSLFIGVLESRTIQDQIIAQFGLMNVYSAKYAVDARKRLSAATTIKQDEQTGIIGLSVEDRSPQRAAAIARAYVDDLNKVLADVNTSSAHRERVFLEQRLAEVKKELHTSSQNFSHFASANTAIDIPEQGKAMVGAAADLEGQLIASESMLRGLQQIYTDNNARVRQMKAQVDELRDQLDKLGGKGVNPEGSDTLAKDELYPSIRELPLLGVKYLELFRQNKIDEAVYELLTKQYEIAKMEEARDVPSVEVLDVAEVPEKKSSPHRLWIMLGGMCFSFIFAAGWIVSKSIWRRTDPGQPWRLLGEEVYTTYKTHPAVSNLNIAADRAIGLFRRNRPSNGTGR